MKKTIILSVALIGLLMLTESCSSRRYYKHHKPKQACRGGDWGGNLMEKRIW
jgi:hypothetical protein